jgi:DNA invertase Pin-like site-specific DNA recombinase
LIYGYARVSTQDQELSTQIDALHNVGVEHIFEEKRSGGDTKRAELEKVLTLLGPGDTLVVYKLDRIARSLRHLLLILDRLSAQGAQFRSLTETIDTNTAAGRMMMQIVGAFAEFELEMIRERTKAGLHAAMRRGSKPGRPRAMRPDEEREAVQLVTSGQATKSAVARKFGTHISSVKRALHRANGQIEIFDSH